MAQGSTAVCLAWTLVSSDKAIDQIFRYRATEKAEMNSSPSALGMTRPTILGLLSLISAAAQPTTLAQQIQQPLFNSYAGLFGSSDVPQFRAQIAPPFDAPGIHPSPSSGAVLSGILTGGVGYNLHPPSLPPPPSQAPGKSGGAHFSLL